MALASLCEATASELFDLDTFASAGGSEGDSRSCVARPQWLWEARSLMDREKRQHSALLCLPEATAQMIADVAMLTQFH